MPESLQACLKLIQKQAQTRVSRGFPEPCSSSMPPECLLTLSLLPGSPRAPPPPTRAYLQTTGPFESSHQSSQHCLSFLEKHKGSPFALVTCLLPLCPSASVSSSWSPRPSFSHLLASWLFSCCTLHVLVVLASHPFPKC